MENETEARVELNGTERIGLLARRAGALGAGEAESLPALAAEIRGIARAVNSDRGEAESLLVDARYHALKGSHAEAIALSQDALRRFGEAGDGLGRVKALSMLGHSFGQLGRLETALEHSLQGLALLREHENPEGAADGLEFSLLNNVASVYSGLGRLNEALDVLQEVLKHAEKAGGETLVLALSRLCEAYLKQENIMNALVCNQRALMEIRTKNLGDHDLYQCHFGFGMIYEKSKQYEKAFASYTEALACAERTGNRYAIANAQAALGSQHMRMGNAREAALTLRKALLMAEEIQAQDVLRTVHGLFVAIHEGEKDYESAFRHLRRHMEIDRSMQNRELERKLGNYEAEFRAERMRMDAEIHRLKNVELRQQSEELERKAAELEESYQNIKVISEIGRKITDSLDIEMVLSTIYESVNRLMDATVFAIGLYDEAMGIVSYRILMENGQHQPLFQASVEDGRSAVSLAVREGREILIRDADDAAGGDLPAQLALAPAADGLLAGRSDKGRRPRSTICCPLALADRITGVITVQSYAPGAYTPQHLETVKALAAYIAIALNNSRTSEELKAKARELELASRTDPLTGLNNRRHIMEKIEEENIRFQRSGRPFSIIICDIDFFKKINDVYGHDCGDYILRALAALLRRLLRRQDCLARWGGEEFLMLLPETGASGAAILAEKLRQRVEENEFAYAGLKIPVTMTFGVAEINRDFGVDACIVGADSALYKGKSSGRNRVVTF